MSSITNCLNHESKFADAGLYGLGAVLGAGLTVGLNKLTRLPRFANAVAGAAFAAGCASGVYCYRRSSGPNFEPFLSQMADEEMRDRLRQTLAVCPPDLIKDLSLSFYHGREDGVAPKELFTDYIVIRRGDAQAILKTADLDADCIEHVLAYELTILKHGGIHHGGRIEALSKMLQSELQNTEVVAVCVTNNYSFKFSPPDDASIDGRQFASLNAPGNVLYDAAVRKVGLKQAIIDKNLLQ